MTVTVAFGPLLASDAPRCAELDRLLFTTDDPWSEQAFRDELRAGFHYVAARVDEIVVGYAGIGVAGDEAEVHTIGVDPAHQGRGIGRALLRHLLAVADAAHAAVFLEVRTDNEPAVPPEVAEAAFRIEQIGGVLPEVVQIGRASCRERVSLTV